MLRIMLVGAAVVAASSSVAGAGAADDPVRRGEYLARIMDCGGCHTTGALIGKPDPAHYLAGSEIGFMIPGLGVFYPPNLTSDPTTGLGTWSQADIVKAVRTGLRPDGRELAPAMPWRSYASLTNNDAAALAAYLKSLPPVEHAVPAMIGPNEHALSPYLAVQPPA